MELAVITSGRCNYGVPDGAETTKSLAEAQEWDKLECWIVIVGPGVAAVTEEDLENSTLSLFRQRPSAAQKLKEWMERRFQQR